MSILGYYGKTCFIFSIVFLAQWEKVCFWVWGSSHAENFFLKMCRNWYYGKTCFIFSNVFLAQWEFVIGFSGLRWGVRFLQRSFFYFCVCWGLGFEARWGHFFYFLFFEVEGSILAEVIFLFFVFWVFLGGFEFRVFWGIFGW